VDDDAASKWNCLYSVALQGTEEAKMGRTEFAAVDSGSIGEASEDMFFRLGMMYSTGTEVPTDYVSAHKWFNLAAIRGNAGAIHLRREIATEMTAAEIAQAQRAARDWLKN
jgi:TPR repeat protein